MLPPLDTPLPDPKVIAEALKGAAGGPPTVPDAVQLFSNDYEQHNGNIVSLSPVRTLPSNVAAAGTIRPLPPSINRSPSRRKKNKTAEISQPLPRPQQIRRWSNF